MPVFPAPFASEGARSASTARDEISPGPEVLAREIALPLAINTGQMDGALAFDIADHLRDRVFRRDRDHHVNVIRDQMAFLDSAFLLHRQLAKHFPEMLSQLPVKRLPCGTWE